MLTAFITKAATRSILRNEENRLVSKNDLNFTFETMTSVSFFFRSSDGGCQTEVVRAIVVRLSTKILDLSTRAVSQSR